NQNLAAQSFRQSDLGESASLRLYGLRSHPKSTFCLFLVKINCHTTGTDIELQALCRAFEVHDHAIFIFQCHATHATTERYIPVKLDVSSWKVLDTLHIVNLPNGSHLGNANVRAQAQTTEL